jgi:hypothetical protein
MFADLAWKYALDDMYLAGSGLGSEVDACAKRVDRARHKDNTRRKGRRCGSEKLWGK